MVRPVLSVVLNDEDGGLRPEFRLADGLDESTEREVVVSDKRCGRMFAERGTVGVVVRKADDLQSRHLPFGFKALQLSDETIRAFLVGKIEVEPAIPFVEMTLERADARFARIIRCSAIVDEFAVTPITHTGRPRPVPQIPLSRTRHEEIAFAGIRIFAVLVVAVAHGPGLLDEIGGIGAHGPLVAVGADFTLDVKVVEQHKVARQLVVVGGDALVEQAKARVAVAFGQVAEDLVVGAVLFDDVNAILDRTGFTHFNGDRIVRRALGSDAKVRLYRAATIRLRGPGRQLVLELVALRQVDDLQRAMKQAADVFADAGGWFPARLRTVVIRFGDKTLSIGDDQTPAIGCYANGSGIPANRDETEGTTFAGCADIKDGHVVVIGIGHEQRLLVR